MTTSDRNNLALKQILTSICALFRAAMTGDGGTAAAAIILADTSGEGLKPAASAGLEKGQDAILYDTARTFLAMENLGLEGIEPPYAIDELVDEPATGDFRTACVWPLAGDRGERLGILVGFRNHPSGPGEIPREAMGHAAGLAAVAIENGRREAARSNRGGMLETVVENVNQGIALFDKEFRLLHFNSAYQSLYDFPDGFLKRGLPYAEVLRHLIERGEYGSVDTESFLQKRLDSLDEGSEWRKLRHRPNGTVIAVYRKNLPGQHQPWHPGDRRRRTPGALEPALSGYVRLS
jgi:PAS domain-containing protein